MAPNFSVGNNLAFPNVSGMAPPPSMGERSATLGGTVKPNDTEQKIIQQVAALVAMGGEEMEESIKKQHLDDPDYWFLFSKTNPLYQDYQRQLASIRDQNEKEKEENQHQQHQQQQQNSPWGGPSGSSVANDADTEDDGGQSCSGLGFKPRKRKSRWGSQDERASVPPVSAPPGLATLAAGGSGGGPVIKPLILPGVMKAVPPPQMQRPAGTPMPGVAKPELLPLMQKSDALRKAMARKYTGSDEISETQLKQIQ